MNTNNRIAFKLKVFENPMTPFSYSNDKTDYIPDNLVKF